MDFDYLYNPENGIVYPYRAELAENRRDLISIFKDELSLVKSIGVADTIRRRERMSNTDASVKVDVAVDDRGGNNGDEDGGKDADDGVDLNNDNTEHVSVSKGVTVTGKIENPKPCADASDGDDCKVDYTKYYGYLAPSFPVEQLHTVPDCDLVRFAYETMKRKYSEPPEGLSGEEVARHYSTLRSMIAKNLVKDAKKKAARRALQKDIGNSAEGSGDGDNN